MSSDPLPLRAPMTRDQTGTLFGQTMGLVAVTTGLFAVGAYLGLLFGFGVLIGTSSTCSCSSCRSSAAAVTRRS
jgi:hypothetical protein